MAFRLAVMPFLPKPISGRQSSRSLPTRRMRRSRNGEAVAGLCGPHRGARSAARAGVLPGRFRAGATQLHDGGGRLWLTGAYAALVFRSEEHTSELQSRGHLVCRHLLEKKNKLKRANFD